MASNSSMRRRCPRRRPLQPFLACETTSGAGPARLKSAHVWHSRTNKLSGRRSHRSAISIPIHSRAARCSLRPTFIMSTSQTTRRQSGLYSSSFSSTAYQRRILLRASCCCAPRGGTMMLRCSSPTATSAFARLLSSFSCYSAGRRLRCRRCPKTCSAGKSCAGRQCNTRTFAAVSDTRVLLDRLTR